MCRARPEYAPRRARVKDTSATCQRLLDLYVVKVYVVILTPKAKALQTCRNKKTHQRFFFHMLSVYCSNTQSYLFTL